MRSMEVTEKYFRLKKIEDNKLIPFGFVADGKKFVLKRLIAGDAMEMCVTVENGRVFADTYDCDTKDLYTLHTVDGSSGEFVGKVRADFESLLQEIAEKCCVTEIFKQEQSKDVIDFIKRKYGDELEFLWQDLPDAAIWRRKDNNKWYGIIMTVKREKVGLDGDGLIEIIDLRANPADIDATVDNKTYFRGYHMNKKNWLTVRLDYSIDLNEMVQRIEESYYIAGFKK